MRLLSGAQALALVSILLATAGCSSGGMGRAWVPVGPGEVPEAKEAPPPRRPAAAPASAPAPAVAQAEAPPSPFRTPPSASAPAAAPQRTPAAPAASAAPGHAGGYTQATRYGDLLFVSGQIGLNPGTNQGLADKMEDQTRQVMENVRQILENNRLTMANVVSVTVYIKDLTQFRAMDDVYETYFRTALPARSVVEVARLPRGALVEISVIAGR